MVRNVLIMVNVPLQLCEFESTGKRPTARTLPVYERAPQAKKPGSERAVTTNACAGCGPRNDAKYESGRQWFDARQRRNVHPSGFTPTKTPLQQGWQRGGGEKDAW
jgi:hypothetical protein